MASILRHKALTNINKGNTSAYYSYVEEKNGTNPVLQQLEKELFDYMGFVKKKQDGLLKPGEHAPCKVSDALFDIWNKFEPRISKRHFYQKLMQIGEFLVQNREYSAAAWQCYDRYLNQFIKDINFSMIKNVEDLKEKFFPETDSNEDNTDVTFRALMGHCICLYHFTITTDPKLQNVNSIQQLCEVLRIIRLIMQFQLEVEEYCWLVYNGTIYMYTICRYMLQYGLGKQVLEYLIWSCLCMETSIPLLGVKYLTWRATLYVATCQCYYDCKYSEDGEKSELGEAFARRALSKINELHELELASVNAPKSAEAPQFRDATIKIGAMLFKRIVFESRRKGKAVLRPKTRMNYKDLPTLAWPRTATEKLLSEMFDCAASRFLAIEEALSDSNRRIAMPTPAAGEYDVEILDVTLELFFAAEYLANGGGGKKTIGSEKLSEFKSIVSVNKSLIQMAIDNEDTIPIKNLLKIIQLAFSYEVWDLYRRLSNKVLSFFQTSSEVASRFNTDIQILYLLQTIDKYLTHLRRLKNVKNENVKANLASRQSPTKSGSKSPEKTKRSDDSSTKDQSDSEKKKQGESELGAISDEENSAFTQKSAKSKKSKSRSKSRTLLSEIAEDVDYEETEGDTSSPRSSLESLKEEDLLANIANKLMHVINLKTQLEKLDLDVMIDTTLMLWKKCKDVFQKYQTGSQDNYRWVTKLENLSKWLYILNVVHESMCYFNISSIDPAVFAHCTLRLGLVYESLANVGSRKSAMNLQLNDEDRVTTVRILDMKSAGEAFETFGEKLLTTDVKGNLLKAKKILKKSLHSIASARASISKSDKTCLCNKNYDEGIVENNDALLNLEQLRTIKESIFQYKKNQQGDSVWNMIADLHVELIFLYNKISVRLLEYGDITNPNLDINLNFEKNFEQLLKECKKNKIAQSLLYLSKALYLNSSSTITGKYATQKKELIEKAYNSLLKAQEEDKRLFYKHVKVDATVPTQSKVPLPPVIDLTTHNKIVLTPRNFQPQNGATVSWYRIFASQVTGPNSKARISDYSFPGTGDQIPSNNCDQITIQGLNPDEKYIFAVAAYDQNGKLIGDSIGESTDPILASSTLSLLMNWAYLCQISYQTENYNVSKTAFNILWQHFIFKPIEKPKETIIKQNEIEYQLTYHQLNYNVVRKTSPVLLRKFLECLFISVDIQVKESQIYPDVLFDGRIPYQRQIERLKECEKMIVAIDLAGWLNDPQIILQAVVQCYGLVAPLVYYYIPYEPIVQIMTHCLLVLEEVPANVFQRKPRQVFESLQHMNACTTYYLTEILKKLNKKTLANVFNLIGRKLLSIEEGANSAGADDDNEFFTNEPGETKPKTKAANSNSIVAQARIIQQKKEKTVKSTNQAQKDEEKPTNTRNDELKALELYLARSTKQNAIYSILNGNEDTTFIYAFITQSPTKYAHRELIKFRKRTSYMELLVYFLHKALVEELNNDIRDWCIDTFEWLQRRNVAILGNRSIVTKKPGGVVAVAGNQQLSSSIDLGDDADKKGLKNSSSSQLGNFTTFKKRKIKKYKLLIPLELDGAEKIKMEDRQKIAIDKIYDSFPEMHETWTRKKRLRRLLQEESAFKAQFYNIWALTEFSLLMGRIQQTTPQNELVLFTRIYNNEYIEPQYFLFDTSNCLLVSEENRFNRELLKVEEPVAEKAELLPVPPSKPKPQNQGKQTTNAAANKATKARVVSKTPSKASKLPKNARSSLSNKEKVFDIKDTCDLMAEAFTGLDSLEEDRKSTAPAPAANTGKNTATTKAGTNPAQSASRFTNFTNLSTVQVTSLTFREIVDNLRNIFYRFNQAIVITHRYKEWTLLQNTCKTLWNCLNSLLIWLPAVSADNIDIKLNDIWTITGQCLFTGADNLLDMIFYTSPIEKTSSRDTLRRINKWYDSLNVGKGGAGLKFDIPLDDNSSIDLRFVKQFIYRTIQCLFVNRKWEKLASIIFKFNALTSYSFAEQLSPILIFAQHQLRKQIVIKPNEAESSDKKNSSDSGLIKQPHFERLKAELGRQARPDDLLFIQFKIQIDPSTVKPLNLGVKIDPRVHDIYNGGERAKQLISIPLDITQTKQTLKDALEDTLYTSRALIHARRLFSIYLLSKSKQLEFFGLKSRTDQMGTLKKSNAQNENRKSFGHVEFDNEVLERLQPKSYQELFSPNPLDLTTKNFENESDVCVKEINLEIKTVIESYKKCISLLTSHKEKDLAVQAMHELGNIYYFKKDTKNAYHWWTESLDLLTSCKDCLVKWRKEFVNKSTQEIDYLGILEKFGLWGCFMGGLLASKFAQYLLPNDIELRTESCLLAATFYKAIYLASIPHSKHDFDFTKEDSETINTEILLPGLNLNNDLYRFDIRNVIQSLNYICLELTDAKYCLTVMSCLNLYEYFARNINRDINHTILARLLKIDALILLNKYNEAITLLQRVHRGERLPHSIDEKFKPNIPTTTSKYLYVNWNPSKPVYDIENLKCLEAVLSMKLSYNVIKLYGPHLICRFYMVQCKLFVEMATHLTCMPNMESFNSSELYEFHNTFKTKAERVGTSRFVPPPQPQAPLPSQKKHNPNDNPETIKIFTKCQNITLEFIKGCLLGTAKVLITKCIKLFNEDFPNIERYSVSTYWQREFKYELYMLLANIADQSQLDYMALQYVIDAMNELIIPKMSDSGDELNEDSMESFKYSSISTFIAPRAQLENKQSKYLKKGIYEVFDLMSKSHLNSRLWLNARKTFTKYMLNQLSDLGKAKGVDSNITRDFADLKYYCDKGFEEAVLFQDCESKAYFEFMNAILDLTQTNDIMGCLSKLNNTLNHLKQSLQLSLEGEKLYLKTKLFEIDINYAIRVIDLDEANNFSVNPITDVINDLASLQEYIFDKLKYYNNEAIECYTNRNIFYSDFISGNIKNLSSPFLSYLVHVKLRLGSSLIIKATTIVLSPTSTENSLKLWQDALKIFYYALQLNKVIAERSLSLEIELKYKYARCLRELFFRKQAHIKDVVDTFLEVINLCYYSTHDLVLIKNCYLELAMTFIHVFNSSVSLGNQTPLVTPTPDTRMRKNAATAKAIEGALVCLTFAIKVSQSIREKMLLPGHDTLKQMESVQTKSSPIFIANDLLAYFVLAERKRVYRDRIEEEVLTLAPEFEPKMPYPTYDEKFTKLCAESDKSITWTHLLNYQTKLQRISSMKNINQLSSGQNRYKYSEFYTLAFTPIFNNYNQNSARLCEINSYLNSNLNIYASECIAVFPLVDALRVCSRKSYSSSAYLSKERDIKTLLENVKVYDGNKGTLEIVDKITVDQEFEEEDQQQQQQNTSQYTDEQTNSQNTTIQPVTKSNWSYLELWPSNYKFNLTEEHPNKHAVDTLQAIDYLVTLNWYKDLNLKDSKYGHIITAIISVKDVSAANNHQIKIKFLSADKVYDIHHKLATLAAIADTALESNDKNNADMKNEFINSLKSCLYYIAELFNKKLETGFEEFNYFDLKASNVIELERMFNPMFGGQSNDESLKTFLLSFFS